MIPKQYLGAFKCGHRPSAVEFIDEELSRKLLDRILASKFTDKEAMENLAFIAKFNNEFHKNVIRKHDKRALHKSKAMKRSLYARENARNRDILSVKKAQRIDFVNETAPANAYSYEELLIDFLDLRSES